LKLPRRQFLRLSAFAAAIPAIPRNAVAQTYPSRSIRLVVPFPAGGVFDIVARPWADKMKTLLGGVIVENVGGGGGALGAAAVARARPDGYTLLLAGTLPLIGEALMKNRPLYDPLKDLEPIVDLANVSLAIAIHPSVPAQTLMELVAFAKANPGKLSYGHVGIGSVNHLTGEMFKTLTDTPDIVQVPYRGGNPAIADLVSGQLPMAVVIAGGQLLEFHRTGTVRVLAVTGPTRLTVAPSIPTVAEAGLPALTMTESIGLLGPAGTPREIVARITQASHAALTDPAFRQLLLDTGSEPDLDSTPETFRHSLEVDIAHWAPIVQRLGLKLD